MGPVDPAKKVEQMALAWTPICLRWSEIEPSLAALVPSATAWTALSVRSLAPHAVAGAEADALSDHPEAGADDRPHLIVDAAGGIWLGWQADGGVLRIRAAAAGEAEQGRTLARLVPLLQERLAIAALDDPEALVPPVAEDDPLQPIAGPQVARGDVDRYLAYALTPRAAPAPAPAAAPRAKARALGASPLPPFAATPDQLRILDRHTVNLRSGVLSSGGIANTTELELDALVAGIVAAARAGTRRLLLFAHGGLVSEQDGLAAAWATHRWWLDNDVYPVFFIWETGGLETLWQIVGQTLGRTGRSVSRDIFDYTTDPLIEAVSRTFGRPLWRAMKGSAARSSDPVEGGAALFARKLVAALAREKLEIEIHALGHSAGSIFHAYLLPYLLQQAGAAGLKLTVSSLHLLAPAITTQTFRLRLMPLIGRGIDGAVIYTMDRRYELADNCRKLYRKSLLYLIYHALEEQDGKPILGLMESIHGDAALARLFGYPASDRLIPSVTTATTGRSASTAIAHGDFDNDAPTMESVARRILGLADGDALKARFPAAAAAARAQQPPPADLDAQFAQFALPGAPPPLPAPAPATASSQPITMRGQRLALGVGIDAYPAPDTLSGCVADARLWQSTLAGMSFATQLLLDGDATADRIRAELRRSLALARPGDALVFHISSHGTEVQDVDGDEAKDSQFPDRTDEAICGVDVGQGGVVIDDELYLIYGSVPAGVSLTCFLDFCHSGRSSRMLMRQQRAGLTGLRPRFMKMKVPPKPPAGGRALTAAAAAPSLSDEDMRHVAFCACRPAEQAFEADGQGFFTRYAIQALKGAAPDITGDQLLARIEAAFGADPPQHPILDGWTAGKAGRLFGMAR